MNMSNNHNTGSKKWSQLFVPTLKEVPKEATIASHILMLRAGMIVKQGSGVYGYLPLGFKTLEKVEKIVHQEIQDTGGQRVFLPHLVQKELWDLTGRYTKLGKGIFTLTDRHENGFLMGPTHEESIVDMLKGPIKSYKQLPLNFFQIAKKFRDEIRPRYGVMRGREFMMMDGYTLHASLESLDEYYQKYKRAYRRIFARIGLNTVPVSADSGDMGGEGSEEFMVPSHIGDDTILKCNSCNYVANQEKAVFISILPKAPAGNMGEIITPDIKSIEQLSEFCKTPAEYTAKTVVFKTQKHGWVVSIVRGDRDVNEVKLQNLLKGDIFIETTAEEIEQQVGPIGFLGPMNFRKKEGMILVLDSLLQDQENILVGMNKRGYHYQGFSFVGLEADYIADISLAKAADSCSECSHGKLESFSGIEVGHIFKLGDDYSRKMGLQVLDQGGRPMNPIMGCYGIGVDRSLAAVIEQNNDETGIILPITISPFHIVITAIGDEHQTIGEELYRSLSQNYDILLDDRDISAGIKLSEADLIGIPIRIAIGKRYKQEGLFGLKIRSTGEEIFLSQSKMFSYIQSYIDEENTKELKKLEEIDSFL